MRPRVSLDRFIVGTGRCGSTLLSRMLAENPTVCSLFEFFTGLDWERRFSAESVSGAQFAELIGCEQPFVTAVLRRGYDVEEIVYPFDAGGHYRRDDRLPWLLVTMLPRLSDDPDGLFDELIAFARRRPQGLLVEHYRESFRWLAERTGRQSWIERSGSSIEYLASLREMFPDARFVHLHRDGREVALSMREHHAYRLPIALLYDAPTDDGTRPSELGAIDVGTEPQANDPISRILASRPPAEYFGRYWADQITRGHEALALLADDQYMEIRFEDVVAAPDQTLGLIAEFLELGNATAWIHDAARLVRGAPPTRFDKLDADEARRLDEACRPALELLGRDP